MTHESKHLLIAATAVVLSAAAGQAAPASDVPANVPRKGLVAFWTGDGHAKDSLGKHHGTIQTGVTYTTGRRGKAKGAFGFNGKSGFVKIPDKPELDTDHAFTVSAWINPSAYTDEGGNLMAIVAKWDAGQNHGDYIFYVNTDGRLLLSVCAGPGKSDSLYSKSVVPKNTWTHVAATFDRGAMKLYINGQVTAAKVSAVVKRLDPAEYTHDDVQIGADYANRYNVDGAIDEVGIWNRALSEEEVAALFRAVTKPPPAYLPRKGLVAFWTADGHARDSAGRNHGRAQGSMTFTAGRHGKAKGAFLFDGKDDYVAMGDVLDWGKGSWSICLWYKKTSSSTKTMTLLRKGLTRTGTPKYAGYGLTTFGNRIEFTVWIPSQEVTSAVDNAPSLNEWHHVAGVLDHKASKVYLYLDGKLAGARALTGVGNLDTNSPLAVGMTDCGRFGWRDDPFEGAIDEVGMWKRALSAGEIAAIAGPMAGMHVARLAGVDRVEMNDSSVLKGTIQNKQFTVTTPFGKLVVPGQKVAGILPAPKPKNAATQPASQPAKTGPFVHLLLADGQVVTGQLSAREIVLKAAWGSTLKMPIRDIRQCGFGINKTKPAEPIVSGAMVTLRSRQRLMQGDNNLWLQFQTDWGKVHLPIGSFLRIDPADWQGARHRAILANGSVLTGKLVAKLKLKLALGPELSVEPAQVWGITGTAKPVKPAGATVMLRGGDTLVGRFADKMLTVKTASRNVKVHAGGIVSMQFDANKPTSVTLSTWDNKTVKGTLTDAVVGLEIIPGLLTLKVPAAKIANVTQPGASAPREMLEKIEKLIAQLGAESYLDREKAQKDLIAMGNSIGPILKKHLKNPDPEVRHRLGEIIKALGG